MCLKIDRGIPYMVLVYTLPIGRASPNLHIVNVKVDTSSTPNLVKFGKTCFDRKFSGLHGFLVDLHLSRLELLINDNTEM